LMKKTFILPVLAANRRRNSFLMGSVLLALVWCAGSGCSIKRTVRTAVNPKILQAQSATFEELLSIAQSFANISALSSNNLRFTLTSGKIESGELQKYRSAPGYILLKRPDSIRLVVQIPVTKTALLDLLSVGDEFCVWVPRENKFYTGKNSAMELVAEDLPNSPGFTIRATHIFEAILPPSIAPDAPGIYVAVREEMTSDAKYYVLSLYREGDSRRIHPVRDIWIERSGLTVKRQQVYRDEGHVVSDITYSGELFVDSYHLPGKIHIDRPMDGYALDMEFKAWRVNPDLPEDAFILTPPEGAQIVPFKEKGRSTAS